jgi:hypothetical protein
MERAGVDRFLCVAQEAQLAAASYADVSPNVGSVILIVAVNFSDTELHNQPVSALSFELRALLATPHSVIH